VTRAELEREWERRRLEAERHGATAPLSRVYATVLEELRAVDGGEGTDRWMTTTEAAGVLAVAPKTIAKWATRGRFAGARKTSEDGGEWRLPSRAVYGAAGKPASNRGARTSPKLWKEGQGDGGH
jgi:hypothetical protein